MLGCFKGRRERVRGSGREEGKWKEGRKERGRRRGREGEEEGERGWEGEGERNLCKHF